MQEDVCISDTVMHKWLSCLVDTLHNIDRWFTDSVYGRVVVQYKLVAEKQANLPEVPHIVSLSFWTLVLGYCLKMDNEMFYIIADQ